MKKYGVIVVTFLVLGAVFPAFATAQTGSSHEQASLQIKAYVATIPPETLRLYDPSVVDGTWIQVVTITQTMIWELREQPDLGGNVYTFDLEPAKLSTVQKRILRNWVASGKTILLWGEKDLDIYARLFPDLMTVGEGKRDEPLGLAQHPVNTDVHDIRFLTSRDRDQRMPWIYRYLITYPPETEVLASVSSGIVAGKIPLGQGNVYFASMGDDWPKSTDKDRWTLNFHQWMFGKPIPEAARTRIHATSSQQTPPHAVIQPQPERPLLALSSNQPRLDHVTPDTGVTSSQHAAMPNGVTDIQEGNEPRHAKSLPIPAVASNYVEITGDRVNLRAAPTTSSPIVAQANKGDVFAQHDEKEEWYKISMFSGAWRYVHKSFAKHTTYQVALPPESAIRRDIFRALVNAAERTQAEGNGQKAPTGETTVDDPDAQVVSKTFLIDRYELEVAHQFGIRLPEYRLIAAEGLKNGW